MSKPGTQTLLWVNKDANSASFSNNRTSNLPYSQINRHVQRAVKRRQPLQKRNLDTSTSRIVGWQKAPVLIKREEDTAEDSGAIMIKKEEGDLIPRPVEAVDSVCSPTITFDADKQSIIQYFNEIWMPSETRIPPGCQVTGFTPLWPKDGQLSLAVVQGAIQSDNEVSMYALLTASTRRIQMIDKVNYPNKRLPDFYALKAIQALRGLITSGRKPTERLILDMSYMVLAELYVRSPSRSEVYWKMTRDLIISCGGLGAIAPFTAQAATAYDFFISSGTLTLPALNPFEHPAILGLEIESTAHADNVRALVLDRLRHLDPRIQVICEEADRLSQTIKAIRSLPAAGVNRILPYLQDPGSQLYALISAPFVRVANGRRKRTCSISACIKADALAVHMRFHAYMAWLWFSALDCVGDESACSFQAPQNVLDEVPKIWRHIDRIYSMLDGSEWAMQDHVVLWISALGCLVAVAEVDRLSYNRLLGQTASRLEITNEFRLKAILDKHLPLDRIHQSPVSTIWNLIDQARQEPG